MPYAEADKMALRIDCTPKEAEVIVDGVYQGTCGLLGREGSVLRLEAGTHTLLVTAGGYRDFRSMVSARGMRQNLTVNLDRVQLP